MRHNWTPASSHLRSMGMNAPPIFRRNRPAKFRSHEHGVLQKVLGWPVMRRLVEDGAEASLSIVKPAGNQILHGSLMRITNHERGGINIALSPHQLVQLQWL